MTTSHVVEMSVRFRFQIIYTLFCYILFYKSTVFDYIYFFHFCTCTATKGARQVQISDYLHYFVTSFFTILKYIISDIVQCLIRFFYYCTCTAIKGAKRSSWRCRYCHDTQIKITPLLSFSGLLKYVNATWGG